MPVKSIPKEELTSMLPHLYANISDRNADVRKNANEAVMGIMIHIGYETMLKALSLRYNDARRENGVEARARVHFSTHAFLCVKIQCQRCEVVIQEKFEKLNFSRRRRRGFLTAAPIVCYVWKKGARGNKFVKLKLLCYCN